MRWLLNFFRKKENPWLCIASIEPRFPEHHTFRNKEDTEFYIEKNNFVDNFFEYYELAPSHQSFDQVGEKPYPED